MVIKHVKQLELVNWTKRCFWPEHNCVNQDTVGWGEVEKEEQIKVKGKVVPVL
jgi:hypothetical protein